MRRIFFFVLFVTAIAFAKESPNQITIRAPRILDGKGKVITNSVLFVEGSKIVRIAPLQEKASYELDGITLMPGGIDTHVHISWHFDENGKSHDPEKEEESEHSLGYGLENAYATLTGGITTVQSLGSTADLLLRKHLLNGSIPGPRILTAVEPVTEETGDAKKIREHVKAVAARGADLIKIFASKSIREGGGPTLSIDQLKAACGQAKDLGLRSAVHAHGPESVRRAVEAGCTSIEHGVLLDRASLEFIAEHGTYFDPNIGLIFRNYFENKEHFLGIGNYTEAGFAKMKEAVPVALRMFREALQVKNLKIVFGTDAVAGSHGRNFEELIYRVQEGGQSPKAAIISATSLAAKSLNLDHEIGSLAPGMTADIIGVEGNPLEDITALRHIKFIMKEGKVVECPPRRTLDIARFSARPFALASPRHTPLSAQQ
jgi:imidazolonepropionase-like amidohydrolase